MKLNNKGIELKDTESGKRYLLVGGGSEKLRAIAQSRIGKDKFCTVSTSRVILSGKAGVISNISYFLEESDFHLFNAHDALKEGMEIAPEVDYDLSKYDYYHYDKDKCVFKITNYDEYRFIVKTRKVRNKIIARKLKKVFKWRNDRAPKREDADKYGKVATPANGEDKFNHCDWRHEQFQLGMPWAPIEDAKHFTPENPAPPFYE